MQQARIIPTNTPQIVEQGVYHILEDGTVVKSRFVKQVGETHRRADPPHNVVKTKFVNISNEDYTIVCENAQTIAFQWERKKAAVLAARTGWNSVSQKQAMTELYNQFVGSGEPHMREAFFLAMKAFK